MLKMKEIKKLKSAVVVVVESGKVINVFTVIAPTMTAQKMLHS